MPNSITAALPAFNEEAMIARTVQHVASVLASLTPEFEIVVTNDGSRDRTGDILADLQRTQPDFHLRVVTHQTNQGYGAALASAFDAATSELIFLTDGDKQFDVAELRTFLPALDEHTDMVIGYRAKRADPLMRKLNALGWKTLVNALFGYTARDVDCAFKLFRRTVWESVTVHARGATFSAEFLVKARRLGFSIKELPVGHFPREAGSPTGARLSVIVRAFRELFTLRQSLDREVAMDRQANTRVPGA